MSFLASFKSVKSISASSCSIRLITKVTNLSLSKSLTDSQSGFRAYSNKVLEKLNLSDTGMGISTEILIKANKKEKNN